MKRFFSLVLLPIAVIGCQKETEHKAKSAETRLVCNVDYQITAGKQTENHKGKIYLLVTEHGQPMPYISFDVVGGVANFDFTTLAAQVTDNSTENKWAYSRVGLDGTINEGSQEKFSLNRVTGELLYLRKEKRGLFELVKGTCEKSAGDWKKF